jgi:hypothetical protein
LLKPNLNSISKICWFEVISVLQEVSLKKTFEQRRHSEGRKKRYLLLKFDNVDKTKMSNKHIQQNVING